MMLFDLPILENENNGSAGAGIEQPLEQMLEAGNKIESVLALVKENCCVHWVSESDWSMHDLLAGLLTYSGPANVYISSYSFSELPARIIAELKSRNIIKELYCLIDSRIDTRNASALTLVSNCATKCKLTLTHAKITIIENDQYKLIVIGSANYTTNKRFETGVIIEHPGVVNFHKTWMINELKKP